MALAPLDLGQVDAVRAADGGDDAQEVWDRVPDGRLLPVLQGGVAAAAGRADGRRAGGWGLGAGGWGRAFMATLRSFSPLMTPDGMRNR